MKKLSDGDVLLSVREASEISRVPIKTIYRWLSAGVLTRFEGAGVILLRFSEISHKMG